MVTLDIASISESVSFLMIILSSIFLSSWVRLHARCCLFHCSIRQCPEVGEHLRRFRRIHHALRKEDADHSLCRIGVCRCAEAAVERPTVVMFSSLRSSTGNAAPVHVERYDLAAALRDIAAGFFGESRSSPLRTMVQSSFPALAGIWRANRDEQARPARSPTCRPRGPCPLEYLHTCRPRELHPAPPPDKRSRLCPQ